MNSQDSSSRSVPLRGFALRDLAIRPFAALRDALSSGYTLADLRSDLLAGIVVGVIAVPLSMALAINTGVAPQHGLYTAIIAGFVIALLGGSRVQVSGPTAAFVVILAPITAKYGFAGLATATALAGLILMTMGMLKLGRLIQIIPNPVTTGFTSGIALVLALLQVRDFLGLSVRHLPESTPGKVGALFHALPTVQWDDLLVGLATLLLLIYWPKANKLIPPPLAALTLVTVLVGLLEGRVGGFDIASIADRFGSATIPSGIPSVIPHPGMPWHYAHPPDVAGELSFAMVRELLPAAFAIALLGAIESLLSAVVADGMSGHRHDPDAELFAQGVGNFVVPFLGGFAATGAIARTAANIRFGARSPVAAMVHAIFVLAVVLLLSPLLGTLPLAAMAALLIRVAWTMSDAKHFLHTLRVAPLSDIVVLLACFVLTVAFDMVIAVTSGLLLAMMLFMKRMIDIAGVNVLRPGTRGFPADLPAGVMVFDVAGPLFFGAAEKAMAPQQALWGADKPRVVLFDLRDVPAMDMTGLVALETALDRLTRQDIRVVIAGIQAQPLRVMARAHLHRDRAHVFITGSFNMGLDIARKLAR